MWKHLLLSSASGLDILSFRCFVDTLSITFNFKDLDVTVLYKLDGLLVFHRHFKFPCYCL